MIQYRSIEPFQDFVTVDYRLMIETLDVFQEGTHALESNFKAEQLKALATRADRHLRFLLQLSMASRN